MENTLTSAKYNEITYAIAQLQALGIGDDSFSRVYSRYPAATVAAYKAQCAEMDLREANASDTKGTY
jgi:hypothetical protein